MSGNDVAEVSVQVFAKAPVPGRVKTRLARAIGAARAASLHDELMQQALATAVSANIGPVTLYCTPNTAHPRFEQMAARHGVALVAQTGSDLGERMHVALTAGLKMRPAALVIGTDCPFLDAPYLCKAAMLMTKQSTPVVIGPAVDGGYVLFGATRLDPSLFRAVPWGSAEVLAETRRRLQALGWDWRELAPLNDIDRPEDLALIPSRP